MLSYHEFCAAAHAGLTRTANHPEFKGILLRRLFTVRVVAARVADEVPVEIYGVARGFFSTCRPSIYTSIAVAPSCFTMKYALFPSVVHET